MRTCNAKDCYATVPIYSRYCAKHENETSTDTDVIIIDTQPTYTCCCQDVNCCCFDCSCEDCECGCFDDD
jgi:hypothetical protein